MKVILSLKLSCCIKASSPASKSKEDIYFFETKPLMIKKYKKTTHFKEKRKILNYVLV